MQIEAHLVFDDFIRTFRRHFAQPHKTPERLADLDIQQVEGMQLFFRAV